MNSEQPPTVATAQVSGESQRPQELNKLEALIGRWITEGSTEGENGGGAEIVSSDVYEWAVGRRVVIHQVHGRIGDVSVAGLEVISFDPATGQFKTHFYDSFGNVTSQTLRCIAGDWFWEGANARCKGTFTEGGKILAAQHERSVDGINWQPSMFVNIRRAD